MNGTMAGKRSNPVVMIALALLVAIAVAMPVAATVPAADRGLGVHELGESPSVRSPLLPPVTLTATPPSPAHAPPSAVLEPASGVHLRVGLEVAFARVLACASGCWEAKNGIRGRALGLSEQLFGNKAFKCELAPGVRNGPSTYQGFGSSPMNFGDPMGLSCVGLGDPETKCTDYTPYMESGTITGSYQASMHRMSDPATPWYVAAAHAPQTLVLMAGMLVEQAALGIYNTPHDIAVLHDRHAEANQRERELRASGLSRLDVWTALASEGYSDTLVMGPALAMAPGPGGFGRNLGRNLAKGGAGDVVTLWKAPQGGRTGVAQEVADGYSAGRYPGDGPFFTGDKATAQRYQFHYENGLQEIKIPRSEYDRLVKQGVIRPDGLDKAAVHVPESGLPEFNRAIQKGPANVYHPE